jgi:anti-anti-sigma regulatory factor
MTIVLDGEQGMRTVNALREQLLQAIAPGISTTLDLSGITGADLGFVQLVESARRHAVALGGDLCLAGPPPAALRDVLLLAGFADSAAHPFWQNGADPR